jgi:hypothetical protein
MAISSSVSVHDIAHKEQVSAAYLYTLLPNGESSSASADNESPTRGLVKFHAPTLLRAPVRPEQLSLSLRSIRDLASAKFS